MARADDRGQIAGEGLGHDVAAAVAIGDLIAMTFDQAAHVQDGEGIVVAGVIDKVHA